MNQLEDLFMDWMFRKLLWRTRLLCWKNQSIQMRCFPYPDFVSVDLKSFILLKLIELKSLPKHLIFLISCWTNFKNWNQLVHLMVQNRKQLCQDQRANNVSFECSGLQNANYMVLYHTNIFNFSCFLLDSDLKQLLSSYTTICAERSG